MEYSLLAQRVPKSLASEVMKCKLKAIVRPSDRPLPRYARNCGCIPTSDRQRARTHTKTAAAESSFVTRSTQCRRCSNEIVKPAQLTCGKNNIRTKTNAGQQTRRRGWWKRTSEIHLSWRVPFPLTLRLTLKEGSLFGLPYDFRRF